MIRRRLLHVVIVLVLVTLGTQLLVDLMPGDPARALLGRSATPTQVAQVHRQLGLDDPWIVRYGRWGEHAIRGDLGTSPQLNVAVTPAIRQRVPVTLELAALAMLITVAIGVPVGVYAGQRAGRRFDRAASAGSTLLVSSPQFLTGILLISLIALKLRWFPVGGWVPLTEDPAGNLRSAFLPALTLALTEIAVLSRVLRSDVASTMREQYVTAARARGLTPRYVLFRHALRPSMVSTLTLFGLSLASLIGGTVIVESLFSLPGIGNLLVFSVQSKDTIMVQGVVVLAALAYLLVNTLVDILYAVLDPRVRSASAREAS